MHQDSVSHASRWDQLDLLIIVLQLQSDNMVPVHEHFHWHIDIASRLQHGVSNSILVRLSRIFVFLSHLLEN